MSSYTAFTRMTFLNPQKQSLKTFLKGLFFYRNKRTPSTFLGKRSYKIYQLRAYQVDAYETEVFCFKLSVSTSSWVTLNIVIGRIRWKMGWSYQ